jgi:DNA-binding GntR family transcriptional regulator
MLYDPGHTKRPRYLSPGAAGTLASRIAEALRKEILIGHFVPGQRLPERPIAAEHGVSRGPVRSAFQVLHNEGLVDWSAAGGAVVRQIPLDEVIEFFELRAALFALAARLAASRATAGELKAFDAAIDRLHAMAEAGVRPIDLVAQGGRATAVIVAAARAPEVEKMLTATARRSHWHYTHLGIHNVATAVKGARFWKDLAGFLLERNPDAAERAAKRVLRFVQEQSIASLRTSAAAAGKGRTGSLSNMSG